MEQPEKTLGDLATLGSQFTEYPKFQLWKTEIEDSDRLQIVNPEDFPKEAILKGLGIEQSSLVSSFGISDPKEIRNRIELIRFLIERHEVAEWIQKTYLPVGIPEREEEFLEFFDTSRRHTPYWQCIDDLIALIGYASDVPAMLCFLRGILKESLPLEDYEREMAKVITHQLENMTVVEGLMDFKILFEEVKGTEEGPESSKFLRLESCGNKVCGHQAYSSSLNKAKQKPYPKWTSNKWNPLRWLGVDWCAKKYVNIYNEFQRDKAFQSMVISEASQALTYDVHSAIYSRITSLTERWKNIVNGALVHVYFSYSKEGMKVRIYGIDPLVSDEYEEFKFSNFDGYSLERSRMIQKAQAVCKETILKDRQSRVSAGLRIEITREYPKFFEEKSLVDSPSTDREHKWFAVRNLYESPGLNPVYAAMKKHREFLSPHWFMLKEIANLALKLRAKARELNTSISYPKILDGHSLVSFDEIFPIHLLPMIDEKKKIVPIRSLPKINSQMIGLTGYHGGGKTVTGLSITDNIFLAQSGLPVFGKAFSLNVKKLLGVVCIARGQGSTCEVLLQKIKNILNNIKKMNGSEVLLVLDELGTGTQEISGLELGKDLLEKLSRSGVSVIFSTQIQALAQFASDQLGAKCFQFDDLHNVRPGIGDGGMEHLRKRMGLDRKSLFK